MRGYIQHNRLAYEATAEEFQDKIEARQDNALRFLESITPHLPYGARVLELGPGSGDIARLLCELECNVTAIEFSPAMSQLAAQNAPDAKIITAEFISHDFGSSRYDCILGMAFIHLFPKEDATYVVKKIRDLLEPDGVAFISTTAHSEESAGYEVKHNFQSQLKRYRHKYTKDSLLELLTLAGLKPDYREILDTDSRRTWMETLCART